MDNPTYWTESREEILAWLKRNAPSLAELYEGAVLMLCQHSLPGRTRFIGHAVREIRNRLPDAVSGATRGQRLDYTKRVAAISDAWRAGPHEPLIPSNAEFRSSSSDNSPEIIGINPEVHRLIDDLVADHLKVPETRAEAANRFFEECAPENKDLRETMMPVIRNWMKVTDWFMDRTHDSGDVDAACDPEEFILKFELFESILGSLIGAFFASLDELDEILAAPDVTQLDRALALITRAEHHRYFFDRVDDPQWVGPLAEKGFFRNPPPLIPVQGGTYLKVPNWPESRSLARIARSASDEQQQRIVDIALAVPDTENFSVHQDLADIALAVPPRLAVRFVSKAMQWVDKYPFSLVPPKLGELSVHLAREGFSSEALRLARHLLSPLPAPQTIAADQTAEGNVPAPEPCARFESLFYQDILKKHVPDLVRAIGFPAFQMLSRLLESAISIRSVSANTGEREDYSMGWRPAIEDDEENFDSRDLRAMLAVAVRNAGAQVADADSTSIPQIVEELEQRGYPVFDRIALHLLRIRSDSPPGLISERLISKRLFDSDSHRHEYSLLLQDRFGSLAAADQQIILGRIEAGPDLERFASGHQYWFGHRPSAEDYERRADQFRLDRLWPIRNDLPEPRRQRLSSLVALYGEPERPELPHFSRISAVTLEERSPKSIEELRQMAIEDIEAYLRHWQPAGASDLARQGLRLVLLKLVAEDPQRFAAAPHVLKALPSAHLLTMLDGFREAAKAGRPFSWPAVLEFCNHILTLHADVPEPATNPDQPRDPTHVLTDSIAGLLESALEPHPVPIPFDQRGQVTAVLQRLVAVPDSSPNNGPISSDTDPLRTAPFERPTRVKTLEAVVSYAIWVARQLSQGQQNITLPDGLDSIPDVKEILENHLDKDRYPALAVRAFFGRSLPKLVALDAHWVKKTLPLIFPADESSSAYSQAAWRGYILCPRLPSLPVFRMISHRYESAVDRIQPTDPQNPQHDDPDRHLARHIMTLYWHGEIDWGDGKNLLDRFFAKADDSLRADAIHFLGMSVAQERSVPVEVLDRLRRLWEIRRKAPMDQSGHAKELAEFGFWPVSRKFDESWAMVQLTEILTRAGKATPELQVADWLAHVAARCPCEAVRCLELMAEGCDWDFHVSLWEKQAVAILDFALRDSRPESRQAARDLINRFGSRGHHQFHHLLQSHAVAQ